MENLIKTIKQIRSNFEKQEVDYLLLRKLYTKYNKIPSIDSFMEKAKSLFPKLNCGLASLYIQNKLGKGELIKGKYKNQNHTFLLLENNTIIDITSDQYGGPKVYIGPLKKPWGL